MSETITVSDAPTRQPRQPPDRQISDPEPVVLVERSDEPATGPTPEQALADAQAALKAKDTEIATAQAARTRAEREAARAQAGRASDRSAAVAGAVEAAQAAKASARASLKAAREAGDIDAEMAAAEALSQAAYRETAATAELAAMKATEPTSAANKTTDQGNGYSPQAKAWIDAHPRFNSDPAYKQTILAAHGSAVSEGIIEGSPAYFRELDRVADTLDRPARRDDMATNRGFNGAAPARDSGRNNGGANTVNTLLGPVQVWEGSDGKTRLKVPPHLRADFEEGAKVTHMDLGDYIMDQVSIAREQAAGGDASLVIREGVTYR